MYKVLLTHEDVDPNIFAIQFFSSLLSEKDVTKNSKIMMSIKYKKQI